MKEVQLHAGEYFHLKDGFIRPGMGGGWASFGPMWTWTESDMRVEMGWCMAEDCKTIRNVPKGETLPQAIEVCCEMPSGDEAKTKVADKKAEIEAEFLALGAKDVWFVHWGHNDDVYPTENGKHVSFSTGVFMGVK